MFYLDVVYVCNGLKVFLGVFASVFNVCCKYFSCFKCILQVFHLDVVNIDRVFLVLQWALATAVCCNCWGSAKQGIDVTVGEAEGA
jgi:hypothetical protein